MVVDEQQIIRGLLQQYFFDAQGRNPRFSTRAFAKKLGVSSSSLSEILRGKRKISSKKSLEFAETLNFKESQVKVINDAFNNSRSLERLKPTSIPLKEIILTPDNFHIMSDRIFFNVLAMLRSKNKTVDAISAKLGVESEKVFGVLEEFVRLGVLIKKNDEYMEQERVVFRTSDDFPLELMKIRRLQNNKASKIAIEKTLPGERGYFSTVSLDREKLDEAIPIIEDFLKRLSLFLRKPGSEDIFEINIDIFPWSK